MNLKKIVLGTGVILLPLMLLAATIRWYNDAGIAQKTVLTGNEIISLQDTGPDTYRWSLSSDVRKYMTNGLVTDAQATNISAYQAQIATNTLWTQTTNLVYGNTNFIANTNGIGHGVTIYGDGNRTNAVYVGPSGQVFSNANGNVTIAGGTIVGSQFARMTNGFVTVGGTNQIYSLATGASDYERYLFEPRDTNLVIRADTAGSGDDNLGVVIMPVGNGAFYLDNAGTTAGNVRGVGAVDLQMDRSAATQIASGQFALLAGRRNTASGQFATAFGNQNSAVGVASVALGQQTTVSGSYAFAAGLLSAVYSNYACAFGNGSLAHKPGGISTSSDYFAAGGDAQYFVFTATCISAANSQTNVTTTKTGGALTIYANKSWSFYIQITARSTDAGTGDEESAAYEIKGLIERDNTAANTRIVGTPVITTLAEDDAAWDVSVSADTTNGALQINVTGNNETAVRWVATVHLTEVGG